MEAAAEVAHHSLLQRPDPKPNLNPNLRSRKSRYLGERADGCGY